MWHGDAGDAAHSAPASYVQRAGQSRRPPPAARRPPPAARCAPQWGFARQKGAVCWLFMATTLGTIAKDLERLSKKARTSQKLHCQRVDDVLRELEKAQWVLASILNLHPKPQTRNLASLPPLRVHECAAVCVCV